MQSKKFSKDFEVHYYEIDRFQKALPRTLINYMEDTAISHSASVGYDVNVLKAANTGWILYRWSLHIDKYPLLGEKVTVETWPSSFERFHATREFLIKNTSGEILAKASSLWIFFNTEKRKPMRIPMDVADAYCINPEKVLDNPFNDISSNFEHNISNEFAIRYRDIDTNNHVNNISYIDWIMETLPVEIHSLCRLNSLEIIYRKEISAGKIICLSSGNLILNENNNITNTDHSIYLHKICDLNNQELAVSKTVWSPVK